MNDKVRRILVNSSYTVFSNFLSMLVSALVVLVLPKIIGVTSYGYWQLYLFYVSYIGFFHLGWIDGIYLKYGGEHLENLDKKKFFSQFIIYTVFQTLIAIVIWLYSLFFVHDDNQQFIFNMLAITLLLTNLRFFLIYILQTTNHIKQSSTITMMDRLIYVLLLLIFILFGSDHYQVMIYADIAARFFSLLYGVYLCRSLLLISFTNFVLDMKETVENIRIGSNLMLSNVASLLIIGTVRLGIERTWDIATFGKVSLTLSISNLMMIFINAIGIVIYPMLRRLDKSKLPQLYIFLRNILMLLMLGLMLMYYPMRVLLNNWLPNYNESIKYMALIFPMTIYEGKMSLLINTYLKALRMEKYILKVNVMTVGLSVLLTVVTTLLLKNIELAIFSIVILLAFRCVVAERMIAKTIHIHVVKDIVCEIGLSLLFITTAWFLPTYMAVFSYLSAFIMYLFMKKSEMFDSIKSFKKLVS